MFRVDSDWHIRNQPKSPDGLLSQLRTSATIPGVELNTSVLAPAKADALLSGAKSVPANPPGVPQSEVDAKLAFQVASPAVAGAPFWPVLLPSPQPVSAECNSNIALCPPEAVILRLSVTELMTASAGMAPPGAKLSNARLTEPFAIVPAAKFVCPPRLLSGFPWNSAVSAAGFKLITFAETGKLTPKRHVKQTDAARNKFMDFIIVRMSEALAWVKWLSGLNFADRKHEIAFCSYKI